jgi:lambda family phage portal protein
MNPIEQHRRLARDSRTLADRVVGWFSPQAGAARMKARMELARATGEGGGYKGGRRDSRWGRRWRPAESSADADILPDLSHLRGRARDLARNMPIASGAIATSVTNVIGEGLKLRASVDHEFLGMTEEEADQLERAAEREWELFSKSVDWSRSQQLPDLSDLVYRSKLDSGDVFIVRRWRMDPSDVYGTKIQIVEADRVSNPERAADNDTITAGVEFSKGVPVAYHVSNKHPGNLRAGAMKWERVPARTMEDVQVVLHLFDKDRPEQTRGVPFLAPVIEALKQLGDYSDAEISAAVISAFYTVILTSDADEDTKDIASPEDPAAASDLDENEMKLGKGAILRLGTSEKVDIANPGRPNVNFDPFFQAICRQIGVALELPFELLIKHFTASYSASRAAIEMAWQSFRKNRKRFARNFHHVLYEWMWAEAVATGRLNAPGFFDDPVVRQAYCGWAEWIGPSKPSINPKAEAEADQIDIETGVKTREDVCMERTGGEAEDKIRQLGKEQRLMNGAGITQPTKGAGRPSGEQEQDSDLETRKSA